MSSQGGCRSVLAGPRAPPRSPDRSEESTSMRRAAEIDLRSGSAAPPQDARRVAIVHERFTELGGSERVVEQLHSLWPDAVVHAAVIDRRAVPRGMAEARLCASPLQHLYRGGRRYAHLLPLIPMAIERLDL